jgi:hypothetical protein
MTWNLALPEVIAAPPQSDPYRYGTRMARQRLPELPGRGRHLQHPSIKGQLSELPRQRGGSAAEPYHRGRCLSEENVRSEAAARADLARQLRKLQSRLLNPPDGDSPS